MIGRRWIPPATTARDRTAAEMRFLFSLTLVRQQHEGSNLNEESKPCDNEPKKYFIQWESAPPRHELRMLYCLTDPWSWLIACAKARCRFKIMTEVRRLSGHAGR